MTALARDQLVINLKFIKNDRPEIIILPKLYKTRPVSQQPYGSLPGTGGAVPSRPLSTSETNLYHQADVVPMRGHAAGSTVSSPSNSYLNVFAEVRLLTCAAQSKGDRIFSAAAEDRKSATSTAGQAVPGPVQLHRRPSGR